MVFHIQVIVVLFSNGILVIQLILLCYVYVYTPSLNPILIEQNVKQIFSYNRTKHRYEFPTIGQKNTKIFLQSDKIPIWYSYNRTKHRYDFLIIGRPPIRFSYNRTTTNTIFLQSDKTPVWFSHNRTKHRYDFRKYIVLRTRSCKPNVNQTINTSKQSIYV